MKIVTLSPQDRAIHRASHKVIIGHADLAALGATTVGTIAIFPKTGTTLPAGTKVEFAQFKLSTAFDFSNTDGNSLLIVVGDGGSTNRYIASTQLAVDGTEILYWRGAAAASGYTYTTTDTVDAIFTAGGGAATLADANAGEIEIYLDVTNVNELSRSR